MPPRQLNGARQGDASPDSTSAGRAVEPHVSNANRVIVGFPFSSIKVADHAGSIAVADLLGRLCRLLADGASADEFAELATDAQDLTQQLRR